MKHNNSKLKQKIILIPIIMIIMITFIIPNYAHAGLFGDAGQTLINVFIMLPDGVQYLLEENFLGRENNEVMSEETLNSYYDGLIEKDNVRLTANFQFTPRKDIFKSSTIF